MPKLHLHSSLFQAEYLSHKNKMGVCRPVAFALGVSESMHEEGSTDKDFAAEESCEVEADSRCWSEPGQFRALSCCCLQGRSGYSS